MKFIQYLLLKIKLLDFLFQTKPNCSKNKSSFINSNNYYQISSISHPELTNIYQLFYRNKKRLITYKTLNALSPTSLLIWYLDDGTNIKRFNSANIATNRYSKSEVRMVSRWFWHKHRIKTTVQQNKRKTNNEIKIYYTLYILKKSTPDFFSLLKKSPIFKQIPDCMAYKFPLE